jgi:hypothetical protein
LEEEDALIAHWFGPAKAKQIFIDRYFGLDEYRWMPRFLAAIVAAVYACLVLPGLVAREWSLLLLLTVFPFFKVFGIKSRRVMRSLILRRDFIFDVVLVILVLLSTAVVLKWDVRICGVILIFVAWLDDRTMDARVIFWHTSTHGSSSTRSRIAWKVLYILSAIVLALVTLAFVLVYSLGLVSDADYDAALYFSSEAAAINAAFRNITLFLADHPNALGPDFQYPPGYYAKLKYSQFSSDGLLAVALFQMTHALVTLKNSKKHRKVVLIHMRAPVRKNFVDFVEDTTTVFNQTDHVAPNFAAEAVPITRLGSAEEDTRSKTSKYVSVFE